MPALFNHNLPLDVIEGVAWGQEWQAGYDKHPPLSAWAMESFRLLFARADLGQYFLSQLFVAVTLVSVWRLARDILAPRQALLATLSLVGVYFCNFTTPEFNANVCLMPLWALAALLFWRAARTDETRYWALAGVASGLGMLAKYAMVFLLIPIAIAFLVIPQFRHALKRRGPYIALGLFATVIVLHLVWAYRHDLTTVQYAMTRARVDGGSAFDHIWLPSRFVLGLMVSGLAAIGLLACAGLSIGRRPCNERSGVRNASK